MNPQDLIAALGVIADPNASAEDKAEALNKLSTYFSSLLDSQEAPAEPAAPPAEPAAPTEQASANTPYPTEQASEAAPSNEETSKEMASALATIKALADRVSKLEKASAVGGAPRAQKPTVIPRVEPPAQKDHVVSMIEAAGRNTLRNVSK